MKNVFGWQCPASFSAADWFICAPCSSLYSWSPCHRCMCNATFQRKGIGVMKCSFALVTSTDWTSCGRWRRWRWIQNQWKNSSRVTEWLTSNYSKVRALIWYWRALKTNQKIGKSPELGLNRSHPLFLISECDVFSCSLSGIGGQRFFPLSPYGRRWEYWMILVSRHATHDVIRRELIYSKFSLIRYNPLHLLFVELSKVGAFNLTISEVTDIMLTVSDWQVSNAKCKQEAICRVYIPRQWQWDSK